MTLSLDDLDFLTSPPGYALLGHLAQADLSDHARLPLITALRKTYTADQARAAVTLAAARIKARGKFGPDAARLYITDEAVQQASDPAVRRYRVRHFDAPASISEPEESTAIWRDNLLDVCCGAGSDALTFAAALPTDSSAHVLGLDIDAARVRMAGLNAAALGLDRARFEVADVRDGIAAPYDAIFYDPARREDGRRIFDVEQYQPPLSLIRAWDSRRVMVKLSPGVDLDQLRAYPGSVEFISVEGDLKEALLRTQDEGRRLAATLIHGGMIHRWTASPDHDAEIGAPLSWLVEPDPALIRAGLVQSAAAVFSGQMLDEMIAYFTTAQRPLSPWARAWQLEDWMPFNLKRLRSYLRERGVGKVTVKKRGSAITPEALITGLKLKGDATRTVVITRLRGEPVALICRDYDPGA
jgi:hypothetical protein